MDDSSTVDDPVSLARLWESTRERLGDYPSLWFEGSTHGSGELFDRATRVATGLRRLGVGPGDRVVVLMANCPEVSVTYHAVWRAGAAVTPVIFLVTAAELRRVVEGSGAVALVTTAELVPKAAEATAGLRLPLVVLDPGEVTLGDAAMVDYQALEAEQPGPIVDRSPDDLAALLFTGGTTGRSKGVPLTHANLWHAGRSSRRASEVPGLVRGINALPLSHSYGILVTVGALHVREPEFAVLLRWFDPVRWLALAAEHRVQKTAVVPSMLAALLAQPLEEHDLSELRNVFSGAAPLPAVLAEEFERRVPSAQVLEGYGLTESAGLATTSRPGRGRRGTVGVAAPGVEIRVVADDGTVLPPGRDGEVVVRGPNVMAGYWADEEASAAVVAGGWLRTGDIGRLDADGYLSIVDRKKDLIIRGGYNVYPRDVEDVLVQHPAVSAAAVVGRPDARLGEEVVAFVAIDPGSGVTAEDLVAFARTRLAANMYPREVRIVDAVPLTPVGKIDRKQLRARITRPASGGERRATAAAAGQGVSRR